MSDHLPPRLHEGEHLVSPDSNRSVEPTSAGGEAVVGGEKVGGSSALGREQAADDTWEVEARIRPVAGDPDWPRELVLASAGTGKTFHITSRLIALLAYGAEPDQVLASTFTRKAAGEILHRTLDRLAEASLDDSKAADLAGHASIPGAPPLPIERSFWIALLERTVRKLHRLNVGTLDSFFIRAARAFEHDLEMPSGWRIAEESSSRQLRSRVLQDVISSMDRAEMTELLRLVNRGEARRSVHLHLLGLIEMLVTIHRELDPEVDGHWGAFGRRVVTGPAPSSAECDALAQEVEQYPLPTSRGGVPNRYWARSIGEIAAGLRLRNWSRVLKASLCDRRMKGDVTFDSRSLDEIGPLLDRVLEAARRALRQSFVDQMAALGHFTARFESALARAQSAEGLYRFDDVTRLLAGDDPLGQRLDLYYRLDARTQHILLDEFQDTSLAQWEALSPIVEEVLATAGRTGVIVADPKQSIYGWRGAEPRLVRHIGEIHGLTERPLHRSYRSSQVVLDLVNDVFGRVGDSSILAKEEACRTAAEGWARDFTPHRTTKVGLPGYVSIEAGPRDPGSGRQRPLLCRRTAERIAEIHELAPRFTIGVLTRTNATVARMIIELRRCGLHPSEEGGNPLTDSAACEAVLALIRLADHPGDTIARYHVAHSPVGRLVGLEDHRDSLAAATVAGRLRRELIVDGYGAVLNRLAGELAPFCDARELRRLRQLVELAYRHDARGSLRPSEFVYLAETERIEDPARARVRVMTVHQAKGLEFDVVVLPELDSPLFFPPRFPAMPVRREPAGRVTAVYPNLRADVRGLFPEVEEAFAQATGAALRDGLSNFYVALTRARYATFALIAADDPSRGFRDNLTAACILREALERTDTLSEGDVVHRKGNADWWRAIAETEGADERSAAAEMSSTRTNIGDAHGRSDHGPGPSNGGRPDPRPLFGEQIDIDPGLPPVPTSGGKSSAPQLDFFSGAGEAEASTDADAPADEAEVPRPTSSGLGEQVSIGDAGSPDQDFSAGIQSVEGTDPTPAFHDGPYTADPTRLRFPDRRRSRRLPRRTPSQLEGDSRVDVRYLLRLDTREAMRRGSIVHAWLERITWIDDGIPGEAELNTIASRVDPALAAADSQSVLEEFRRSVAHPAVRNALSRAAYPTGATPTREVRFLHREGDTLVEGSIDRLVLTRDGDRVVAADVIDFKTDLQTNNPAILADRVRHYTPQLAAYCRAVAAMYRLPTSAVTGKLVFLDSGRVVATHPA